MTVASKGKGRSGLLISAHFLKKTIIIMVLMWHLTDNTLAADLLLQLCSTLWI